MGDIKHIILHAISQGTDIGIARDANEALETTNQQLHKWIAECSLISTL
jgi:hypothetical protein